MPSNVLRCVQITSHEAVGWLAFNQEHGSPKIMSLHHGCHFLSAYAAMCVFSPCNLLNWASIDVQFDIAMSSPAIIALPLCACMTPILPHGSHHLHSAICVDMQEQACHLALIEVEKLLRQSDKSVAAFGMEAPPLPPPERHRIIEDELRYDPVEQQAIVDDFLAKATMEQRAVFDHAVTLMDNRLEVSSVKCCCRSCRSIRTGSAALACHCRLHDCIAVLLYAGLARSFSQLPSPHGITVAALYASM